MLDYTTQLQLRIATFDRYLQLMVQRRAKEKDRSNEREDCAIVFTEDKPQDDAPANHMAAAKILVPELTLADGLSSGSEQGGLFDQTVRLPDNNPAPADGASGSRDRGGRFVQFAFLGPTFYLELPNTTLFPPEAERLMRLRAGFFWLRDRRWPWYSYENWRKLVSDFNPVQKEYLSSDTRSAAEDMAWIVHTLWHFPVDWQWYFHALRFGWHKNKRDWEGRGPVV